MFTTAIEVREVDNTDGLVWREVDAARAQSYIAEAARFYNVGAYSIESQSEGCTVRYGQDWYQHLRPVSR